MLSSLADRVGARPKRTLLAVLAFVVLAGVLGGNVFTALDDPDAFVAKDSESRAAVERLERASGLEAGASVVVLHRDGPEGDRALAREIRDVDGIAAVASSASAPDDPRFVARDGGSSYLAATLRADADRGEVVEALTDRFAGRGDVALGGRAVVGDQLTGQVSEDLARAESFAIPILIVLSLIFFGGGRAALLPLAVGATTVLGTFLALLAADAAKDLSVFAVNLVIGLGLGLAIDYTLFLLTRYREEAAGRGPGPAAVRATMATAGRTVVYSAATVAVALATLTLFPLGFLQSMGIGGALVATIAALASLVITPALLTLWGPRLVRGRGAGADASAHGRWYRLAHGVMRRPGTIAAATAALMVVLALPALQASWTPVDATFVPRDLSSRQVADALAAGFPRQQTDEVVVAVDAPRGARTEVEAFADDLGALPGARAVVGPRPAGQDTWRIGVVPEGSVVGEQALGVVEAAREAPAPFEVLVGGVAAEFADQQSAIGDRLPLAVGLLAVLTFALLWLMTGSVVLPVKALVMNALTVGAALGALKLVFQDGRFEDLLGYTANGGIETTDFLVTAATVFALSTDYGVFLLGRIKEARESGLEDREAVAAGLAATGRVVTAAAILLAVAIGAFATSDVLFIQQVGIGTAFGVLVDAFVVRALLVPSLMALLGRWNWWSPAPLRRLHARVAPLAA